MHFDSSSSPVIANITGNADNEIILASNWDLVVWDRAGNQLSWDVCNGGPQPGDFVLRLPFSVGSAPGVGDLDADGDLEVVVGGYKETNPNGDGALWAWSFDASSAITPPWPVFRGQVDNRAVVPVTLPEDIFSDNFDACNLNAWSSSLTDGGDLAATGQSAIHGACGMRALLDDTNQLYVRSEHPNDENRYRARFYVNPNGFTVGNDGERTKILQLLENPPQRRLVTVLIRRLGGQYLIAAKTKLDNETFSVTDFIAISDDPHAVEIDWQRSTSPTANNGRLELWIDGVSRDILSGLDNNLSAADEVRFGIISVKPGAAGTLHFDSFVSRRSQFIGLVP